MNLLQTYKKNLLETFLVENGEIDLSKIVQLFLTSSHNERQNFDLAMMLLESQKIEPIAFINKNLKSYFDIMGINTIKHEDLYKDNIEYLWMELNDTFYDILTNRDKLYWENRNYTIPDLSYFQSLESLYISNCTFDKLDSNIHKTTIKNLYIINSNFEIDPKVYQNITMLKFSDSSLDNHNLTNEHFNLMVNVNFLILRNMQLTYIPEGVYEMHNLNSLNIQDNERLEYLDIEKMNRDYMPLLTTVYINDTALKYEDDILEHLYNQGYIVGY